jgi:hypothetical protein
MTFDHAFLRTTQGDQHTQRSTGLGAWFPMLLLPTSARPLEFKPYVLRQVEIPQPVTAQAELQPPGLSVVVLLAWCPTLALSRDPAR